MTTQADSTTGTPEFPVPAMGYTFPHPGALKRWAGHGPRKQLSRGELDKLKNEWAAEMRAAGWVVAWVDPATGQIANAS